MPYVITIAPRADHAPERNGDQERESHDGCDICAQQRADTRRTAVATLEEAQRTAVAILGESIPLGPPWESEEHHRLYQIARYSAGTISLPDGTVIEVRPIEKFALGFEAGLIASDHPQLWNDADLVAKFNRTGRYANDPR